MSSPIFLSLTLWQRLRRTPYQSISAIFMVFITVLVMAVFLMLALGSSAILSYFETKPQLTIFFKDDKDKISVDQLIEKLKESGKLSSYQFISKEQALSIYREQNKNDPLLLEMVTADILPSSLEVTATSPQFLGDLADLIKPEKGIDEIVYQKDVVETLISWTSTVRKVGVVFILFLLVSTFIILFNTIGMRIAFNKEEIEILKLVGATPWYIKRPFLKEGIIYGITGAIGAWLVLSSIIFYLRPFITSFLQGINSLPLIHFGNISINIWPPSMLLFIILFFVLSIFGFMIGFCSSLFATSRYMKY